MIWLFLKDYNKSSKDFKRLYLHEKKNDSRWFLFNLFYLQRMLQFIKEKKWFDLFLFTKNSSTYFYLWANVFLTYFY